MPFYIQLNEDGLAISVTETSAYLEPSPQRVNVDGLRSDLLGQIYDPQASAAAGHAVFAPPPLPPAQRRVSVLALRRRFAPPERAAIEWAAVDRADQPTAQRQQAAALRASLADQAAASFIDLDDADTIAGVQALEAMGLLAPGRATQILAAQVAPEERP